MMKQYITTEQYFELSKKGRKAYKDRWQHLMGDTPNVSIGQMIEFLDDVNLGHTSEGWEVFISWKPSIVKIRPELCDALWEAVKEVLNGRETNKV